MNTTRIVGTAAAVAVVASLVATGFPSAANAANTPGGRCSKAGITVHVGNVDLRCTKKGSKLVWVKLAGQGGGSGSGSSAGIASNASIPKVIQNWGLAVEPYDAGSGKAGVMQIKGVTPPTFSNPADDAMYRHILGIYGEEVMGAKEPQMAFIAPLGTPVISMVDGTVCDVPQLYSNDYSVRVAPSGTACMTGGASILFEHEHLINPVVKVGDKVKAGQQVGTVSDYNPHWKTKGLGVIETGIFFSKNDSSGKPWHACLANYLAPSKRASMLAVLTSIEQAWIAERNDPTLYNLAAQNPVGCLTTDDITDSNIGRK
jgi:biotin carboxyl carrier protein